jgi:copper chaperone CopZ
MTSVELTAPDISCDHCRHHIEEEMAAMEGLVRVSVTVPDRSVLVEYDEGRLDLARIRDRMAEIGYPVA